MICIRIKEPFYQYDAYHITKAFYPNEEIHCEQGDMDAHAMEFTYNGELIFIIEDSLVGELPMKGENVGRKACKHRFNLAFYQGISNYTKQVLDWGMLTGMRPTKVAMKKWEACEIAEEVVAWLQTHYGVSEEKSELAMEIAMREKELVSGLDMIDGYSLYIGIPFCKTRCSYCSFTAYALDLWKHRIDEYLDAVCKELEFIGAQSKHKKLNTIYVGGGTPTSLEAEQLDRLLTCVETNFAYEHLQEITVEAGRPDSITREKLQVMKDHNVGRISINPQTMQEKTLQLIGRKHTVQDIYDVYHMARELGFQNINMDLIVGLPEETLEDVEETLKAVAQMKPDSLTVHALAMKRASKMTLSGAGVKEVHHMNEMIHMAAKYSEEMGLKPYYLYRQKNTSGNYENVGYAKVDKAGIYNILIMEEKQSIIAVGAGAATKIVLPREKDNIVRIENVKDVQEYMKRIDEMIERKGEWLWH